MEKKATKIKNWLKKTLTWPKWDTGIERVADVPWGVLILAVVVCVQATHGHLDASDIRAIGPAVGLLGIGHGLHSAGKHLSKHRQAELASATNSKVITNPSEEQAEGTPQLPDAQSHSNV